MAGQAMLRGVDVVVSNTFVKEWELQPYLEMAKGHKCTVEIFKCTENFESIHDVPERAIQRMKKDWQEVSGERKV